MASGLTRRRFFWWTTAIWALAWGLPSYASGYGWWCYLMALGEAPSYLTKGRIDFFFLGLSPWTNLLWPVAVLALHLRRFHGLRSKLPALFVLSFLINAVWPFVDLGSSRGPKEQVGYYLWLAGFLAVGVAVHFLLKTQEPGPSLLISPASGVAKRRIVTVGAVVVLVAMAYWPVIQLVGLATRPAEKPEATARPPAGTEAPPVATPPASPPPTAPSGGEGPAASQAARMDDLTQFVKGYAGDVRATPFKDDERGREPFMSSTVDLASCRITVEILFQDSYSKKGSLYTVALSDFSPSSVGVEDGPATQARFVEKTYGMAGVRLLARNARKAIQQQQLSAWRKDATDSFPNPAWVPAPPVSEVFLGVSKIEPPRIAKALQEIIRLCGGADEPF